ncbi:hotdog fold thioesterase [Aureibacillus halotolerans]|uniref:Uncharacterized protein (TIGR00369 family) n=1 Tax=Aureibacillus halotolerans TaxID=1508390 RepID=A0A4R6U1M6_9BACI|nr:PaaI family thioesterase [Aureibacillus halotolerans]TDQ40308.1 uncharacterized protein (TIGR00369 family) [Aureibacillus halotolerans]
MSMLELLQVKKVSVSAEEVILEMPVNENVHQPMGYLHGGASVFLAETAASLGALEHCEQGLLPVGLEINANHIRPMKEGILVAKATPVHKGKTTMVWEIKLTTKETHALICLSRCTIALKAPRA